jgi:hypothetical protein
MYDRYRERERAGHSSQEDSRRDTKTAPPGNPAGDCTEHTAPNGHRSWRKSNRAATYPQMALLIATAVVLVVSAAAVVAQAPTNPSSGVRAGPDLSPSLTLVPSSGAWGSTVEVEGMDFAADSSITATATPDNEGSTAICPSVTTDTSGSFACDFIDPSNAASTVDTVTATDGSGGQASAEFALVPPSISVAPNPIGALEPVTVTLAGFMPFEEVQVNLTNPSAPLYNIASDPDFGVGNTGSQSATFDPEVGVSTLRGLTAGTYQFEAYDTRSRAVVTTDLTISPGSTTLSASSVSGDADGCSLADVTITGSGFAPGVSFEAYYAPASDYPGYASLGGSTTTSSGGISASFSVTSLPLGSYTAFVEDADGNYAAAPFSCTSAPSAYLQLNPASGPKGFPYEVVQGFNFAPDSGLSGTITPAGGSPVEIPFDGSTTGPTGEFGSPDFTIPISPPTTTTYTVSVSDAQGDTASAIYTVVSPSIFVTPAASVPGTTIEVSGYGLGWDSDNPLDVFASLGSTGASCHAAAPGGSFSCSLVVPLVASGSDAVSVIDEWGNSGATSFQVLSPPTAQFPAYLLTVQNDSRSGVQTLPGVRLAGIDGFLLNSWSLCFDNLTASTNLTSQSAALYNVALFGGSFSWTLHAFILGQDPSANPGVLTILKEGGTISGAAGQYGMKIGTVQGGSGQNPNPSLALVLTAEPPFDGLSTTGASAAVGQPPVTYPADIMFISGAGRNAEVNPIVIDGASGSWVYRWSLADEGTIVVLNLTLSVSLVSLWLTDMLGSTSTFMTLYEFTDSSGPAVLVMSFHGAVGSLQTFNEAASAGSGIEFSGSFASGDVS